MAKNLGYTRITIPGFPHILKRPVVIQIGGKNLEEVVDDINKKADDTSKESAKREPVEDVTNLTDKQLDALRCGDVVVKEDSTGQHAYLVSYKSSSGICITYTDCENVETVAYDKTDSGWVFNSKDVTHIGS